MGLLGKAAFAARRWSVVSLVLLLLCHGARTAGEARGGVGGGGDVGAETQEFLAWVSARGVDFSDRFEIAENRGNDGRGRGLIAVRSFVPGELLLATSNSVMFTPDTARRSRMGARYI